MQSGSPFFVVGCPRSGTTLLSVLLDRHSRLCVTPETGFFDEIAPRLPARSDRGLFNLLNQWRRLPELNIVPDAVLNRLSGQEATSGRVLKALLELYAMGNGKVRCGEKTPQHLMHVPGILDLFPEARVLCLLRNGIDVTLSLRAMPWWKSGSLRVGASLWLQCVRLSDQFTDQYPSRFSVVRYEDLVTQPTRTMTAVMAFLGEAFEPQQLDPATPSDVVLPRSIKWKGESLRSIRTDSLGWRRANATERQLSFLRRRLGDDLRRIGY